MFFRASLSTFNSCTESSHLRYQGPADCQSKIVSCRQMTSPMTMKSFLSFHPQLFNNNNSPCRCLHCIIFCIIFFLSVTCVAQLLN